MSSFWGSSDFTKSNTRLTEPANSDPLRVKCKVLLRKFKYVCTETTVEPLLFIYMMCISLSSFTVQNMHLEKSCRVNLKLGAEICDRIRARNTTGLEEELNEVQSLVAKVMAWKFPLQTGIPALMMLLVGAWSDKCKRRKILMLMPIVGEIVTNIGLLFATYYFDELSLAETALIEALPPAFTGSYIIMYVGAYSFMSDRTSIEDRTVRYGIASIFASLGTPTGIALSGITLHAIGYYGMFTMLFCLHCSALLYGVFKFQDILRESDNVPSEPSEPLCSAVAQKLKTVFSLVYNTFNVAFCKRENRARTQILLILVLYMIMVGPLYGDSQVAYLYAIKKFGFTEVEYSLYGTIIVILGLIGMFFCVSVLSKRLKVMDCNIGALAGVSRIAGCFMFAFAPNRHWFYSAPVFNMFSTCSLPILRSMMSKIVSSSEIAKLYAMTGLMEALAPSVYMPMSSFIYVNTIESFPGAFYMFDSALTVVALVLFLMIYILLRQRNETQIDTKDKLAKSNEVSRF